MVNNYFGIYVQALLAKNSTQTLQKQLKAIKDLQVKVTPTFGKINKSQLKKVNDDLKEQLGNLTQEANKVDLTPSVNQEAIQKISNGFTLMKTSLQGVPKQVQDVGESFNLLDNFSKKALGSMDSLLGIVGKVTVWGIATNAVYGTKRALQELFQEYVAIEDKMVSIQRVTNNLDMDKIFDGAYQSAQKYGASLNDMLDSVEEIARSYSDLTEAELLATAEAGILASTVAEMDGESAVQAIIAVSNAYGFAIENGTKLIDMANEVDNNFSVTSNNITKAWEKSSATAKTFGVDIENLTGYIAAISTVTQESGEVIGTGLKTIMSRMTTMDSAISALKDVQVGVFDNVTGDARDVQDILGDLAEKWGDLKDAEQQNIGVKIAGRYQLTRFLALMNNWELAVDATNTALNSEGSAIRENAIYMNSYTAKLNQLDNAQKNLSKTIYDSNISGWGKAWIDLKRILTDVISGLFKVVDATTVLLGSIPLLIVFLSKTTNGYKLLTNALSFFMKQKTAETVVTNVATNGLIKNRLATKLATAATNLKTAASNKATIAENANNTVGKTSTVVAGLQAKAYTLAAGAVGLLSKALSALPGVAIVAVIGLIIGALNRKSKATEEATQKAIENADAAADWRKELQENVKSINDYKDILASAKSTTEDLENAENSLLDIQTKLISKYGDKAKELDLINGKYEDQIKLINELEKENAQKWLNENQKAINTAKEELGDTKKSYETMWGGGSYKQANLFQGFAKYQGLNASVVEQPGWSETSIYGKPEELIEYWNKLSEYVQKSKDEVKEIYGLNDAQIQEVLNDAGSNITKLNDKYAKHIKILDEVAQETLIASDGYQNFLNEVSKLEKSGNATEEEITKLLNSQDGLLELFEATGLTLDDIIKKYETKSSLVSDLTNKNLVYIETEATLNEEITKLNENIDNLQNAYDTVRNAIEEYNKSGILSLDTMQKLLDLDERYLITLINEKGQLVLNEQSYRNMADAMLDEAEAAAYNQAMLDMSTLSENANATAVDEVRKKYINLSTQLLDTSAKYYDLAAAVVEYQSRVGVSVEDKDIASNIQKALDSKLSIINKARASLNKSVAKTINSGNSSSSKETINYLEIAESALLKYKSAVEAIENELKILQEKNKQLIEGSQSWFNNINEQRKVIDKYKKDIKTYIKQIEIQLKNSKLEAEDKVKLTNKIQDLNLEYEKLNTTLTDLTKTEADYYKGQIENKIKLIENLEDKRHDAVLDNIKSEREAFKKQIDEQLTLLKKASAARTYEQELNELQEKRLNILSQISRLEGDDSRVAKSKLVDLHEELKDVNKEIDNLNYDRNVELREDALNDLSDNMDLHYDDLENQENLKNELIEEAMSNANDNLKDIDYSIEQLIGQLKSWDGIMNNFNDWTTGFNDLVNTLPNSNIVSSAIPLTGETTTEDGTKATQIILNITASSDKANDIAGAAIDALTQAGVIINKN